MQSGMTQTNGSPEILERFIQKVEFLYWFRSVFKRQAELV